MRNTLTSLLVILLLASPAVRAQNPAPSPQDADEETIRISTNLVLTDVSVFDRQGKFVGDLQQSDFELKVDGKPQPLTFFEHVAATQSTAANNSTPNAAAPNAPTTSEQPRTITFFVDDLHLTPQTVQRTRQTLNNFIDKQMTPGTSGMIVAASGRVGFLAQPTDDKAVLKAAVRRITYQSRAALSIERPVMTEIQAIQIDRGDREALAYQIQQTILQGGIGSSAEQYVRTRARSIRRQAAQLSTQIVQNLEAVVRSRPLSTTRQIVFFISNGFAIDNAESDIVRRLRRVTDQAARRNVVIYTLDARGLEVGSFDASSDVVSNIANIDSSYTPGYSMTGEISISQEVLRTLAEDTGGRALLNNNALESLVANVINETSSYYLLGWRPDVVDERTGEPKFRRIEVDIKGRPGLKVRSRRGFFNRPQPDAAVAATPAAATPHAALNSALNALYEQRAVPVNLYAAFVNDAQNGLTLTAAVQLTSDRVDFADAPAGSNRQATVNLACVVLDEAGKAVYSSGHDVRLTQAANAGRDEQPHAGKLATNFTAPVAKPGLYQFRVAARDAQSGRVGTAFQWIEAPEIKPQTIALSSLLIAEAGNAANAPGSLNVERRFRRASRLLLQLFIYNAAAHTGATPDVTMELQVKRGEQSVLDAPAHPVTISQTGDMARIPYTAAIPLRSLTPGLYTLQATAIDRRTRASARQQITFTVE